MEFLLQNFPAESIIFFRRVLFLALTTGLLVVIPLTYQVIKCWSSTEGRDQKVKWWVILRLFAFCTQNAHSRGHIESVNVGRRGSRYSDYATKVNTNDTDR
eukprot:UN18242